MSGQHNAKKSSETISISCENERKRVQELTQIWAKNNKTKESTRVLIPECTADGQYKVIQCHSYSSTSSCWCVNPISGKTIKETWVDNGKPMKCPGLLGEKDSLDSYHNVHRMNRYDNQPAYAANSRTWDGCKAPDRFVRKFNKIITDTVMFKNENRRKERTSARNLKEKQQISRQKEFVDRDTGRGTNHRIIMKS